MAELALIATVAGSAVKAAGTLAAGAAAKDAAYFEAEQYDSQARESRAIGQRQALEQRRKAGLLTSKLQARAAASGGGADDPTVVNLSEDIIGRGEYEALADMYRGESRARGLLDTADAKRRTGDAKMTGAWFEAAGTLLGTGVSAYDRWNKAFG